MDRSIVSCLEIPILWSVLCDTVSFSFVQLSRSRHLNALMVDSSPSKPLPFLPLSFLLVVLSIKLAFPFTGKLRAPKWTITSFANARFDKLFTNTGQPKDPPQRRLSVDVLQCKEPTTHIICRWISTTRIESRRKSHGPMNPTMCAIQLRSYIPEFMWRTRRTKRSVLGTLPSAICLIRNSIFGHPNLKKVMSSPIFRLISTLHSNNGAPTLYFLSSMVITQLTAIVGYASAEAHWERNV